MKKVLLYCCFLSFFACKKEVVINNDYVIFGDYHGFCAGDCTTLYKLTSSAAYPDLAKKFHQEKDALSFSASSLPDSKYDVAKSLFSKIPTTMNPLGEQTFGCPDCADQGGIYIEVSQNNVVKKWLLDTNEGFLPKDVAPLAKEIKEVMKKIQ